jgi:hypothetical protein
VATADHNRTRTGYLAVRVYICVCVCVCVQLEISRDLRAGVGACEQLCHRVGVA